MTLPTIISDRTNDGITIVEFLVAVMQNELEGFRPCHRLQAARLLTRYGCACKSAVAERGEAFDFILDNLPEPSRQWSDSGSSDESEFDAKLAKVIQESTDDGRSVCRFLINVMEGELKAFGPHQRIAAARELLSRGFGKHARDTAARTPRSSAVPTPQSRESTSPTSRSSDAPVVEIVPDDHDTQQPVLLRRPRSSHVRQLWPLIPSPLTGASKPISRSS